MKPWLALPSSPIISHEVKGPNLNLRWLSRFSIFLGTPGRTRNAQQRRAAGDQICPAVGIQGALRKHFPHLSYIASFTSLLLLHGSLERILCETNVIVTVFDGQRILFEFSSRRIGTRRWMDAVLHCQICHDVLPNNILH